MGYLAQLIKYMKLKNNAERIGSDLGLSGSFFDFLNDCQVFGDSYFQSDIGNGSRGVIGETFLLQSLDSTLGL